MHDWHHQEEIMLFENCSLEVSLAIDHKVFEQNHLLMALSAKLVKLFFKNCLNHFKNENVIFRYSVNFLCFYVVFILSCSDPIVQKTSPNEFSHMGTQVSEVERSIEICAALTSSLDKVIENGLAHFPFIDIESSFFHVIDPLVSCSLDFLFQLLSRFQSIKSLKELCSDERLVRFR